MQKNVEQKWYQTTTAKMGAIALMVLLLLIPVAMVKKLIREREMLSNQVKSELSQQWGKSQTILGPVLHVPFHVNNEQNDGKIKTSRHVAHFLPSNLEYSGNVSPEIRYRGIYKGIVYQSDLDIKGNFSTPDFNEIDYTPDSILWHEAFITIGISDLRGIQNVPILSMADEKYEVKPGLRTKDLVKSGITIPLNTDTLNGTDLDFAIKLNLSGSENLEIIPVGKKNVVNISSPWKDPSFIGAFLPDNREINKDGFKATWLVTELNRNFPQQWIGKRSDITTYGFGVNFLLPVDQYQKSMRSIKYAILFISLTFLVFFFLEIHNNLRIHIFQYLLIAFALILFYTLLTSLSEHIGFNWAYLISSISITSLIFIYSKSIFTNKNGSYWIGGILGVLYLYLFTLLQLQDFALLMGSIGLFIILCLVMYFSRKINFFEIQTPDAEAELTNNYQ